MQLISENYFYDSGSLCNEFIVIRSLYKFITYNKVGFKSKAYIDYVHHLK